MTSNETTSGPAPEPGAGLAWRTRDIVVTATIGVVFAIVFLVWQSVWGAFAFLNGVFPVLQDWVYGMWFAPAILAAAVVRKPGAAFVAEIVAAALSALIGNAWGPDALISGFVQGLGAEVVFAATRYRNHSLPVLALAAVASAVAAWAHDWALYYAGVGVDLQLARLILMAVSAIVFAALGSLLLRRELQRAGVLEGFGA
jgi:energy-coupling factor transport system substrate-specific component